MKYGKKVIVDDDGRWFYDPGETQHSNMTLVSSDERIKLLALAVRDLEERVALLEKQKNKLPSSRVVVRKEE